MDCSRPSGIDDAADLPAQLRKELHFGGRLVHVLVMDGDVETPGTRNFDCHVHDG